MGMLEGILGVIMSYPFYGCMGYNGYQCEFYGIYDHQSYMWVCLKMGYTPAMAVFGKMTMNQWMELGFLVWDKAQSEFPIGSTEQGDALLNVDLITHFWGSIDGYPAKIAHLAR